ncbi:purine permease 3 [Spinacia oleracea]|uniref:Probable purine permease n=1 Tax=Spinacia oleracea TaxID=3562 RepID=A0A9R0KAY6_SPIOL|nr:purine permease 3-like [Spinacia oleracea]
MFSREPNTDYTTALLLCKDKVIESCSYKKCRYKGLLLSKREKIRSENMEMESQEIINPKMKKYLLILNCVMLGIGISGGPLVMRLYYIHGGKSIWLSSWLETGGWPLMIIPLLVAYFRRLRRRRGGADPTQAAKLIFINTNTFFFAAIVGLVAGAADYCYAYGVKHIPVSTSSLILATQLAFTAVFAFILVNQKFTPYSINSIALLTFAAIILAVHSNSDKPAGESNGQYYLGFFLTLASSALFALMLPMIELTYKRVKQSVVVINYSLVMEIQLVLSFSATVMCTVGMLASGDYKEYAREMQDYKLGKAMYFVVLICSAIVWQFFYLGAAGVIFYGSSLLSGVIISVALPITEIAAVFFYHETFQVDKGVSLLLSLWGFISYFYGEAKEIKKQKKRQQRNNTQSIDVES